MKVLDGLDQSQRDDLRHKYSNHPLFETHIRSVLDKTNCFRMEIFADDYSQILIHSCLPNATEFPYQPLADAVAYIKDNPDFLNQSASGCLNGQRVYHYMTQLNNSQQKKQYLDEVLGDCFLLDKSEISQAMRIEVTDGMHRLVGYGYATNLDGKYFPIFVFLGTDRASW